MKYNIKDIADEGIHLDQVYDAAFVRTLLAKADINPVSEDSGLQITFELTRADATVFVRGKIKGYFYVACARCLEPAKIIVDEKKIKVTFLPPASISSEKEEELSLEDLDTFTHDGIKVDLEPLINEVLVLSIPITPLCQNDCKGICKSCGADLNATPCSCTEQPSAGSPWVEALERLKNN